MGVWWANAFATPYDERGQSSVVSRWGASCTLPNISELDAWQEAHRSGIRAFIKADDHQYVE